MALAENKPIRRYPDDPFGLCAIRWRVCAGWGFCRLHHFNNPRLANRKIPVWILTCSFLLSRFHTIHSLANSTRWSSIGKPWRWNIVDSTALSGPVSLVIVSALAPVITLLVIHRNRIFTSWEGQLKVQFRLGRYTQPVSGSRYPRVYEATKSSIPSSNCIGR